MAERWTALRVSLVLNGVNRPFPTFIDHLGAAKDLDPAFSCADATICASFGSNSELADC
jgi:hypothetical protein